MGRGGAEPQLEAALEDPSNENDLDDSENEDTFQIETIEENPRASSAASPSWFVSDDVFSFTLEQIVGRTPIYPPKTHVRTNHGNKSLELRNTISASGVNAHKGVGSASTFYLSTPPPLPATRPASTVPEDTVSSRPPAHSPPIKLLRSEELEQRWPAVHHSLYTVYGKPPAVHARPAPAHTFETRVDREKILKRLPIFPPPGTKSKNQMAVEALSELSARPRTSLATPAAAARRRMDSGQPWGRARASPPPPLGGMHTLQDWGFQVPHGFSARPGTAALPERPNTVASNRTPDRVPSNLFPTNGGGSFKSATSDFGASVRPRSRGVAGDSLAPSPASSCSKNPFPAHANSSFQRASPHFIAGKTTPSGPRNQHTAQLMFEEPEGASGPHNHVHKTTYEPVKHRPKLDPFIETDKLLQRRLAGMQWIYGEEALQTSDAIVQLGDEYWESQRQQQARAMYEQALIIRVKHLGQRHPYTVQLAEKLTRIIHQMDVVQVGSGSGSTSVLSSAPPSPSARPPPSSHHHRQPQSVPYQDLSRINFERVRRAGSASRASRLHRRGEPNCLCAFCCEARMLLPANRGAQVRTPCGGNEADLFTTASDRNLRCRTPADPHPNTDPHVEAFSRAENISNKYVA